MKKLLSTLIAGICAVVCAFSFVSCGGNSNDSNNNSGGNTHTKHNWSTTYTPDDNRDQHYQTCDGCDEKQYSNHDYGTDDTCVCGKTKPADAHTDHNWSKTYTPDDKRDQHYQTCDGCDEKQYSNHDYGTSDVCVCGKTKPETVVAATGVKLNKSKIELEVGGAGTKLTATVLPENATDKKVTYSVEPAGVVSVDNDGNVTVVDEGTAVITATTTNNKTATCNVTVTAPLPTDAEIIAALEEYCAGGIFKKCLVGVTVDTNKISNDSWYINKDTEGNITSAEYMFYYKSNDIDAIFKLGKATFSKQINANNLVDGNIGNVTYTQSFSFSYNQSIQERRSTLTNAICDKVFGVNTSTTRLIVDKGTVGGAYHSFQVLEINGTTINEAVISFIQSTTDEEFINSISSLQVISQNSYDISGIKLTA